MTRTDAPALLTPKEVAAMWNVDRESVYAWIHSGELKAINVAVKAGGRPIYRIDPKDLAVFAQSRVERPAAKPVLRINKSHIIRNFR